MIGRQFDPYMRAVVAGEIISKTGRPEFELWGQDPLEANPDLLPKETWAVWQKIKTN